jgi:hypothetical protein
MRKPWTRGLTAVSSVAVVVALAAPSTAGAASTRAEYIAQVDPICQSFVSPIANGFKAFRRAFKATNKQAKAGNAKAFLKSTRRTANTLNRLAQLHLNMTRQITAVPPAPGDEAIVRNWLTALGQEQASEVAAVTALRQLRFGAFFKRLAQADAAVRTATTAISGFGFAVCGVSVS